MKRRNPLDVSTLPSVIKSKSAIEIFASDKLTLTDRRLFNHLLAIAAPSMEEGKWHSVSASSLKAFASEVRDGVKYKDNRQLRESLARLQQTIVTFDAIEENYVLQAPLIGSAKFHNGSENIEFSFALDVTKHLKQPAIYSRISLLVQYQFESKYSLILYEFLQREADRRTDVWEVPPLKVEALRSLLGCEEKYKNWKDLRNRTLEPAIGEINKYAPFRVEFSEVRRGKGPRGGQVRAVIFNVFRKNTDETRVTTKEIDKPRLQRRGEKKQKRLNSLETKAVRFLEGAPPFKRLEWAKIAEKSGIKMPPSPSQVAAIGTWAWALAEEIVKAEKL